MILHWDNDKALISPTKLNFSLNSEKLDANLLVEFKEIVKEKNIYRYLHVGKLLFETVRNNEILGP